MLNFQAMAAKVFLNNRNPASMKKLIQESQRIKRNFDLKLRKDIEVGERIRNAYHLPKSFMEILKSMGYEAKDVKYHSSTNFVMIHPKKRIVVKYGYFDELSIRKLNKSHSDVFLRTEVLTIKRRFVDDKRMRVFHLRIQPLVKVNCFDDDRFNDFAKKVEKIESLWDVHGNNVGLYRGKLIVIDN